MRDNIEHRFSWRKDGTCQRRLANWHVFKSMVCLMFSIGLKRFNFAHIHSPVQPCQLETYPKLSLHCLNKLYISFQCWIKPHAKPFSHIKSRNGYIKNKYLNQPFKFQTPLQFHNFGQTWKFYRKKSAKCQPLFRCLGWCSEWKMGRLNTSPSTNTSKKEITCLL